MTSAGPPQPASGSPRAAMIGRTAELGELRGAIAAAAGGQGGLFLLLGEPGIGKTRLAEELAAEATRAQLRVVWGRCHEAEGRPPYWPWAQVIQACARDHDPADLAAALLPDALPLAELVPALRPHAGAAAAVRSVDPDTARFRLFQALAGCLGDVASRTPLLVILDDLHWADLPSLHMLEFLAHELPERPLVMVGTLRDAEVRRTAELAAAFDRLGRRGRPLPLAGFTRDEVARFVEGAAGERLSDAMLDGLHHASGGNPFFLDEIVRQARAGAGWSSASPSRGVRSAIRQRLAPLPAATRELLDAAAVAGREFDLPLLAEALDVTRETLLERFGPALESGVVAALPGRAGRYRFGHALLREAIYEEVRPSQSVGLHRRFGEILESRYEASADDHLPELAHHFFAAAAGGAEAKALDYVTRAGRHALRALAYEDAAEHFRRALHLYELSSDRDPARECELLLDLVDAEHGAGRTADALKACRRATEAARRLGSSALLARAAIGLCEAGAAWAEFGRCDEALVRTLEEALAQLGPDEPALRAPVMARIATEQFWTRPMTESDALSAEAVRHARSADDGHALAYALMARIHCISDPDAYAERRAAIDEVLALSGGAGKLAINAYLWRFGDELQYGDRASAHASGENLVRAVEDLRQPRDMWLIPAVRSRRALMLGHFAEAERLAEELIAHAGGVTNAEAAYLAILFTIRREQGRHGEMLDGLAAIASTSVVAVWHAPLALLYAENGDAAQARAVLETLLRDGAKTVRRDLTWLFTMACLAAACHASDSRAHASTLYDALAPYDGCTVVEGVFCYFGPVSYYLGLCASTAGRHADAARHLDAAVASARGFGARPFVARILLAQAQAIEAAGGNASRAAALRDEAVEMAEAMGMAGVADAARRAPSATPARPVTGETASVRAGLRREGDVWIVSFQDRSTRVKAMKGFVHLARLLAAPGREFNVLEMVRLADPADAEIAPRTDGDLGPLLDPRAKREVRERLDDLRDELAEAEANNDPERAARARAELEWMAETMASAVGLGGRDRVQGAAAERARAAVTKALRAAIERIARFDAALGDALGRTVRTGLFCAYEPLAQMPIVWDLDPEA